MRKQVRTLVFRGSGCKYNIMKKRRKKLNHFGGWVRRAVQDTIEDRDSHESDASDLAEIIVICVLQNPPCPSDRALTEPGIRALIITSYDSQTTVELRVSFSHRTDNGMDNCQALNHGPGGVVCRMQVIHTNIEQVISESSPIVR